MLSTMKSESPNTRRALGGLSLLVIAAMAGPFLYSPVLSMLGLNSRAETEFLALLEIGRETIYFRWD
jgi:hypothetical protein